MASRFYKQFLYSDNPGLTYIEGSFKVGTNGVPMTGSFVGSGLWASSTIAVQKAGGGSGIYQLTLEDPFTRLLDMHFDIIPGPSSCGVVDGSGNIALGRAYQIVAMSASSAVATVGALTDWHILGVPSNVTPAPGVVFVATSGASHNSPGNYGGIGAGSGVLQLIGNSGLSHVELMPGMNCPSTLNPTSSLYGSGGGYSGGAVAGGSIWFQTRLSSSAAPVNATCGTTIRFGAFLRNSSLLNQNEVAGTATVTSPFPTN